MPPNAGGIALPSDDKRWRVVEGTMRRHGHRPDALIETLHTVQETFGYLEPAGLRFVARSLQVPLSKVFGVATFYHHFTLKPQGAHTCVVCLGTACYIKGGPALVAAVREAEGVAPGGTSADGKLSLITARCLGACSLAPAVVLDGVVHGHATAEELLAGIREWDGNEP